MATNRLPAALAVLTWSFFLHASAGCRIVLPEKSPPTRREKVAHFGCPEIDHLPASLHWGTEFLPDLPRRNFFAGWYRMHDSA